MSFERLLPDLDGFFESVPPRVALAMRYLILAASDPDLNECFSNLNFAQRNALEALVNSSTDKRPGESDDQWFARVFGVFMAFADLLPDSSCTN
jgi:hypothetical protein